MSNTRKTTKPKGRSIKGADGEPVPLLITLPGGGAAEFHSPIEAPPRRTRQLEIVMLQVSPLLRQLGGAQNAALGSVTVGSGEVGGVTVRLSPDDATLLSEFTDVAAWAYLKSWRDGTGAPQELPEEPDGILDLPGPVYHAVTMHAAKLLNAGNGGRFTVDSLPDDLDDVDEDLPTSA